jgi:hypothetical protein
MRFSDGNFAEFESGDRAPEVPGHDATYEIDSDGQLSI